MDRDLVIAWVEALRSGDYAQGKRRLHWVDLAGKEVWCCLGVACDVAKQRGLPIRGKEERPSPTIDTEARVVYSYNGKDRVLPDLLVNRLGMSAANGFFHDYDANPHTCLAVRNDMGIPFAEIADIIEARLLSDKGGKGDD